MFTTSNKFIPGITKIIYGGVSFGRKERQAIDRILDKNWWGPGEETKKFEKELAKSLGLNHAIFVNSGSSALDLGIKSLDLTRGSEVIVPAVAFPTPVASLIKEGLIPVVVDIEEGTNFIDPSSFENSISKKTKAVLIVYAAGNVGNLDEILRIAKKYHLIIIEDNCDGFGGSWDNKPLGSYGTFSAISTHAAHIISTGTGGVVFTSNQSLADKVSSIRDWGRVDIKKSTYNISINIPKDHERYTYANLGSNYQALELQAAMGRVQLRRLDEFKKARQRNFNTIFNRLKKYSDDLILPKIYPKASPCWFTFPIVLKKSTRAQIIPYLDKAKVEWRPILAGNIAKQPAFKTYIKLRTKTPIADRVLESGFWIPVHPKWPTETMEYIADVVKTFLQK